MDNVSIFALILMKSSRAWHDEFFFVSGCTHVNRPFGGFVLLFQRWYFEFLEKGSKKREQEKSSEKGDFQGNDPKRT